MRRVSFSMRLAIVVSVGCLMLLILVPTVNAQTTRTLSTVGRRIDDFNRQGDKMARDEMNREMRGRRPTAEERRLAEAKKAQIKEDFQTLQTTYNDILIRLQSREKLTSHYISGVVEKVLRAGSRLRENMEFPTKVEDEKKVEGVPPESSVRLLCIQLHAFLTSPIFETGVLDIVEAAKARDTLDKIIQTSANIRHQLGKID